MKVIITALKAPWPAGAAVGDCVALDVATLPQWAVGKCSAAPDDAEAAFTWAPPAPQAEAAAEPGPSADEQLQAALSLKAAADQAAAEALQLLAAKDEQLQAALAEIAALKAGPSGAPPADQGEAAAAAPAAAKPTKAKA